MNEALKNNTKHFEEGQQRKMQFKQMNKMFFFFQIGTKAATHFHQKFSKWKRKHECFE